MKLMRVGRRHREVRRKIQVQTNIADPQIVISKGQGLLDHLIQIHRNPLWFALPCKTQQILHNSMSPLRLLVQFLGILHGLRPSLPARRKQLTVSKDRRERIIQLVGHPGDELSHCRQLLAVKQLLLGPSQILVRSPRLLIHRRPLDGIRNLRPDRDQQVHVRG